MNSPEPTVPAAPVPPAPPVQTRPPRRSFRSYVWGSLIGALVLIALYTLFMLWYSYSDGDRAGVLQKFSKRGWICKTWEGELAMYVVGGVAPQIWLFSVRDPQVVEQLHGAVGQQVRLGLEAPDDVPVVREELHREVADNNLRAASADPAAVAELAARLRRHAPRGGSSNGDDR